MRLWADVGFLDPDFEGHRIISDGMKRCSAITGRGSILHFKVKLIAA